MNKKLSATKIPYADYAWHITTGCNGVSAGCENCWAKTIMTTRLKHIYGGDFEPRYHPEKLYQPENTKKAGIVFVAPMGDITYLDEKQNNEVFNQMLNSNHLFLQLSKNPKDFNYNISGLPNVWTGVSVESMEFIDRIYQLPENSRGRRFVSFEPLLNAIHEDGDWIKEVDYVIVGGEQAIKARLCNPEWIYRIFLICEKYDKPFFFKQWGSNVPNYVNNCFTGSFAHEDYRMSVTHQFPEAFIQHFKQKGIKKEVVGKHWLPLETELFHFSCTNDSCPHAEAKTCYRYNRPYDSSMGRENLKPDDTGFCRYRMEEPVEEFK